MAGLPACRPRGSFPSAGLAQRLQRVSTWGTPLPFFRNLRWASAVCLRRAVASSGLGPSLGLPSASVHPHSAPARGAPPSALLGSFPEPGDACSRLCHFLLPPGVAPPQPGAASGAGVGGGLRAARLVHRRTPRAACGCGGPAARAAAMPFLPAPLPGGAGAVGGSARLAGPSGGRAPRGSVCPSVKWEDEHPGPRGTKIGTNAVNIVTPGHFHVGLQTDGGNLAASLGTPPPPRPSTSRIFLLLAGGGGGGSTKVNGQRVGRGVQGSRSPI